MMRLAVVGRPIFHSLSPQIFSLWFEKLSIPASYSRIAVDSCHDVFKLAKALKLTGVNVTAPFKREIIPLLDSLDREAERIGAVNTLVLVKGKWIGYNTDPQGVLAPFRRRRISLKGKKCLVLGAGGAGRAALDALKGENTELSVINRTYAFARDASRVFGAQAVRVENLQQKLEDCDILINTVPFAEEMIQKKWLSSSTIVFDAVYGNGYLKNACEELGMRFIPGEEWLLAQARAAFSLFTGHELLPTVSQRLPQRAKTPKKNIALVGFMGSGKSTVGKIVAKQIGFSFMDSDENVETRQGATIADIFQQHGETCFRRLERVAIASLREMENTVLACGGGALLDPSTRDLLRRHAQVIWLHSPLPALLDRMHGDQRPLLSGKDRLAQAKRLYGEREDIYFASADLIVDTSPSAPRVAEKIVAEWRHGHCNGIIVSNKESKKKGRKTP